MPTPLEQLQNLLRELFQFELSDLDFGIYRLFRLKQGELKQFIETQLPATVDKAFAEVAGSDVKYLADEVNRLAERIRTEIDPAALADSGAVKDEFRSIKAKAVKELIAEYETKKAKFDAVRVSEDQKLETFNHLYNFFSRYYDAGDFIPKRFYGARSHYAVPYNGQETFFHWANQDQHYIKTAEAFRDYAFNVEVLGGPFRVRFIITAANVPKDNTKGDRRYFFPLADEATYDAAAKTLTLPFHYRLQVDKELKSANGDGNGDDPEAQKQKKIGGDKLQEALLQSALSAVLAKVKEPALKAALAEVLNKQSVEQDKAEPVTLLLKRLRHFARRNTTDYFIHKHLAKFLTEELEYYIKDQILHIGDLEGDFDGKRRMLRALRLVAADLIKFLAQIEDVQLRLFEKRKFVLRTDYLVTLAHVPKALRKDILDPKRGEKQLREWQELYAFDKCAPLLDWKGKLTDAFLDKHPTLVVNTANFDDAFKEQLLASFDDLNSVVDGVLVKSENYQSLKLLERWLNGRVRCIYIDPPYNTGKDGFMYKDTYRHSSWLAMIQQRLTAAHSLLSRNGALLCSIGDHELPRLLELGERTFGEENHVVTFIWNTDGNIDNQSKIKQNHEYIAAFAHSERELPAPAIIDPNVGENSKLFKDTIENTIVKNGPGNPETEIELPVGFPADFEEGEITPGAADYPKFKHAVKVKESKLTARLKITSGWSSRELLDEFIQNGMKPIKDSKGQLTRFFVKQTGAPYVVKDRSAEQGHVLSVLRGMGSTQSMAGQLRSMGLEFDYPKPIGLIEFLTAAFSNGDSIVLDFFGGSGTTAEAAINLTRKHGKRRKFVVVEVADYFDSIILPRLKKVIFTPEWAAGAPSRLPLNDETVRAPRLVKVLRLESYEDALHNAVSPDALKRSEPRAVARAAAAGVESYRLNYLAKLPADESASMLQLDRLEHPFSYTLEVLTEAGPQTQVVDLVETFNLLLGLDVQRMETWENAKDKSNGSPRRYRVVTGADRAGKQYLVVWRDMAALDPKVERAFLEAQLAKHKEAFDYQLINGDHATPGFESLDGRFKQLMSDTQ